MAKRKIILGPRHPGEYSPEERRLIIMEWLESGKRKQEIWEKYTGRTDEKGHMLRWMRQLGMDIAPKKATLMKFNLYVMSKSREDLKEELLGAEAKIQALEKALTEAERRVKAYETQAKMANLRTTALETLINVAERDLKIDIRKKSVTKPSTKSNRNTRRSE